MAKATQEKDQNEPPHYEESTRAASPNVGMEIATRPNMAMQNASAQALVQRTLGEVQVAVMMAKQFPRDKIIAREKLVNDCCREGLAEKALYSYARGGTDITGPTIRFAEAAKNAWGNIQAGYRELSRTKGPDGVGISEIEAFAWDTENNTRESTTFIVRHWRDTRQGGYALKDERDIRELIANQSKRIERTCILNSIDGDIIEAGLQQCNLTLNTKVQVTPERIEKIVQLLGEFGVTKTQIEKRIQRRMEALNPALLISLNRIYNSLKDSMSKAEEWFQPEEEGEKKPEAEGKGGNKKVKENLRKQAEAAGADPTTGELKGQVAKQNEQAAKSTAPTEGAGQIEEEEETQPPPLLTPEEALAAGNALVTALQAAPMQAKASLFVTSHGNAIVHALRQHGDGLLVGQIRRCGISLPE